VAIPAASPLSMLPFTPLSQETIILRIEHRVERFFDETPDQPSELDESFFGFYMLFFLFLTE
jgi:hypothetical protein